MSRRDPKIALDWSGLERVYAQVPAKARERIEHSLEQYLVTDVSEAEAPLLEDVQTTLKRIQAAAEKLRDIVSASIGPDASPAAMNAGHCVDQEIRRILRTGPDALSIASAYVAACKAVNSELSEDAQRKGFVEGHAWQAMIGDLLDICGEHDLPCSISKASASKTGTSKPSPFVEFVKALRAQLPPVRWQWPSTDDAMAVALSKVRAVQRRGTKPNRIALDQFDGSRLSG